MKIFIIDPITRGYIGNHDRKPIYRVETLPEGEINIHIKRGSQFHHLIDEKEYKRQLAVISCEACEYTHNGYTYYHNCRIVKDDSEHMAKMKDLHPEVFI